MTPDLKDFLADLVSEDRWSPTTLRRLFAVAPGQWTSVFALCDGLQEALERHRALLATDDSEIAVTWLPHPVEPDQAFLVLFYQDNEMASSVAIVTNAYLRRVNCPRPNCSRSVC